MMTRKNIDLLLVKSHQALIILRVKRNLVAAITIEANALLLTTQQGRRDWLLPLMMTALKNIDQALVKSHHQGLITAVMVHTILPVRSRAAAIIIEVNARSSTTQRQRDCLMMTALKNIDLPPIKNHQDLIIAVTVHTILPVRSRAAVAITIEENDLLPMQR
jgi:hypothetical protein